MRSRLFWVAGLSLLASAVGASCSDDESVSPAITSTSTGTHTDPPQGGSGTTSGGTNTGNGNAAAGVGGAGAGPTTNEVKVAFLGDSGMGTTFRQNLQLIAAEDADFVIHNGDFDYVNNPEGFFDVIEDELGTTYPYFLTIGNHDTGGWSTYASHMAARMQANGIVLDSPDLSDQLWATTYLGLHLVGVGLSGVSHPAYAQFINAQLDEADMGWKICNWHQNQHEMQLGAKTDEMGWGVYETCRQKGAIIATAHEHSYHRTKTLTDITNQVVDPACNQPDSLCVAPGHTFVFVQGLGGNSIRNQLRCLPTTYPYGCNSEWAFVYCNQQQAQFGTLFIVFNDGGNPNRARGYFRNINGTIVDEFVINKD